MPPPSPLPENIYKILSTRPPTPLPLALPLSPLDAKDGFMHLSTSAQVPATASRFFAEAPTLWLLRVPVERLAGGATNGSGGSEEGGTSGVVGGVLKWEDSTSHGCFPHWYGAGLGRAEVEEVLEVRRGSGGWEVALEGLRN